MTTVQEEKKESPIALEKAYPGLEEIADKIKRTMESIGMIIHTLGWLPCSDDFSNTAQRSKLEDLHGKLENFNREYTELVRDYWNLYYTLTGGKDLTQPPVNGYQSPSNLELTAN